MQRLKRAGAIVLVILAALGILALATYRPPGPPDLRTDPEVAVTIFPLYDIVRNIAGDAVDVHLILPPGASPHTFEPTPSDVASIDQTDVVYRIGYGLDDWVIDITDAKSDALTLTSDMALRNTEGGAYDPHYWLSIQNAKHMATLAAQDLSSHFPQHAATFRTNLALYLVALDNADVQIRATLDAMEQKQIVTMHDAWYYFAEAYGLTVLGTFETAATEEPTPQHLTELADAMADADLHTIFVDAGESNAAITTFADDNDATLIAVDAEGTTYDSYIDLMIGNAHAFSQNQ